MSHAAASPASNGGGAGSVMETPSATKHDAQSSVSTTSICQLPLAASFKWNSES